MKPSPKPERVTTRPPSWIGPRWLGLYRNADDPRLFVPKDHRWLGKTINLGHPAARWPIMALVAAILISVAVAFGQWLAS